MALRKGHEVVALRLLEVVAVDCRLGVWRLIRWTGYMHGVHFPVAERRTSRYRQCLVLRSDLVRFDGEGVSISISRWIDRQ